MSDQEILDRAERAAKSVILPDGRFEDLLRRRDRKRLKQRIAAGGVGIAIFVTTVWIATTGGPFDRTLTPASTGTGPSRSVPGGPDVDYVIDLRTGVKTPLPEAIIRSLGETALGQGAESQYAASPDGSRLAYVGTGDDGNQQIFIAGIDGTRVHQVTHDPTGAAGPAWSPDGTLIAYAGGSAHWPDLFVLDVARGEPTKIVDGGWSPQFTPDGSSLLYSGHIGTLPVLKTVPVAGGQSRVLFGDDRGGVADASDGSMSPDGSLVTMMGSPIDGGGAVRLVANADGTELRSIRGRASNPAGTWSPDGSRIVCVSYDDYGGIRVVDIATGAVSEVAAEGWGAIWLDGHTLLVEV